jgi:uncharacterized caspase-like protein
VAILATLLPAPGQAAQKFPTRPEDVLIVDCLLPGQVRKIGRVRAFLTPRQPARVSQFECELRGGEYVEYDRADLSTALATWSGKAAEGDPVAMVYVGEAYAKGYGGAPDYQSAALWFQRAADLGSARAKQNLGHLYERGLGVPIDVEKALNLYREAAGVMTGEVVFAADLDALRQDSAEAREALRKAQQIEQQLRGSVRSLEAELEQLRGRLQREREAAKAQASAELTAMWMVMEEEIRTKEQALDEANQRMLSLLPAERKLDRLRTDGPFELSFAQPVLIASRSEPLALVSDRDSKLTLRGQIEPAPLISGFWVNDAETAFDTEGRFELELESTPGDGMVEFRIADGMGQLATSSLRLVSLGANEAVRTVSAGAWTSRGWPSGVAPPKQKALLIANSQYASFPALETPRSDVQAIAAVLRQQLGMTVTVMENATRTDLLLGLHRFLAEVGETEDALIYFAGHGVLNNDGSGAWVPIDGDRSNPASLLPNRAVSELLEAAKARHVLVVADSCYAGTLSGSAVPSVAETLPDSAWQAWLDEGMGQRSRLVLTSGGLSPVPDSIDGKHSGFAMALLDVLRRAQGPVESQRLFREVKRALPLDPISIALGLEPTLAPIQFAGHQGGEMVVVVRQGKG